MNQKLIPELLILASAAMLGCAAPAEFGMEEKLEQSRAAYTQCVAVNGTGSGMCETARQNYQSSQRSYEQMP